MSEADQQRQFIQRPHQYDIVLTPIHIVSWCFLSVLWLLTVAPDMHHQPGPSDLVGNPPNLRGHHGHLFQVGFCSERSRHYAESCLVKVCCHAAFDGHVCSLQFAFLHARYTVANREARQAKKPHLSSIDFDITIFSIGLQSRLVVHFCNRKYFVKCHLS